jgi:D-alanyl-lipoteichoic acid acyltransferase DltB (MBOAT superfamily)
MALGMSKLFGMDLLRNFNYPYFRDIAEFWRWHISLSSWFRIIYIFRWVVVKALNETSTQRLYHLCSQWFWHGANWTYLAWGLSTPCILPLYCNKTVLI